MSSISTCNDPVSRDIAADCPSILATNVNIDTGTGSNRAGRDIDEAINRISSGVDTSSLSDTRNRFPEAAEFIRHSRIRSQRFCNTNEATGVFNETEWQRNTLVYHSQESGKVPANARPVDERRPNYHRLKPGVRTNLLNKMLCFELGLGVRVRRGRSIRY